MGRMIVIFVSVLVLSGLLAGAAFASYRGWGLVASNVPSARAGSIYGIYVLGGGPGSGK